MTWVVDTCVLIDLIAGDRDFAEASAKALQSKMDDVLAIAPITYVELAPSFNGDVRAQDAFLNGLWLRCDFNGKKDVVLAAHHAWHEHVLKKRTGKVRRRPVADVLIGAYAMQNGGGLITRNEDDFRSLYPALNIFNPVKAGI